VEKTQTSWKNFHLKLKKPVPVRLMLEHDGRIKKKKRKEKKKKGRPGQTRSVKGKEERQGHSLKFFSRKGEGEGR